MPREINIDIGNTLPDHGKCPDCGGPLALYPKTVTNERYCPRIGCIYVKLEIKEPPESPELLKGEKL